MDYTSCSGCTSEGADNYDPTADHQQRRVRVRRMHHSRGLQL